MGTVQYNKGAAAGCIAGTKRGRHPSHPGSSGRVQEQRQPLSSLGAAATAMATSSRAVAVAHRGRPLPVRRRRRARHAHMASSVPRPRPSTLLSVSLSSPARAPVRRATPTRLASRGRRLGVAGPSRESTPPRSSSRQYHTPTSRTGAGAARHGTARTRGCAGWAPSPCRHAQTYTARERRASLDVFRRRPPAWCRAVACVWIGSAATYTHTHTVS